MKGLIAALLLSAPLLANATTWTDAYDAGPKGLLLPEVVSPNESVYWTHDITDAASGSFKPGIDTVTEFSITLFLSDDSLWDASEKEQLKIDGLNIGGQKNVPLVGTLTYDKNSTLSWLASLNSDGLLSLTLKSTAGDFWFFGSQLEAKGQEGTSRVPEPTSLALLAAGMIGIVLMRRLSAKAN